MIALFRRQPPAPASDAQRLAISRLFRRLELPADRMCLMHRPHFEAAGLPVPELDSQLWLALRELTARQAHSLIQHLREQVEK